MGGLQRQRYLLQHGYQAQADIVAVHPRSNRVSDFVEIRIIIRIHKPYGTFGLAKSRTIVNYCNIPLDGQKNKHTF